MTAKRLFIISFALLSMVFIFGKVKVLAYSYSDLVQESDEDDYVHLEQDYEIMYVGGEKLELKLYDRSNWDGITYWDEERGESYIKLLPVKQKAKWTSLDETVATVDSEGLVTAVKPGYTHIRVQYKKKTYYCEITVYKPHLDYTSISLKKGETKKIELIGVSAVSYKSSNKKKATVNSQGVITAVKNGKTSVVVKGKDGKKYKCTVRVTDDSPLTSDNLFTIVYSDGRQESFDLSKEKVVIKENAVQAIFGQYPQTRLTPKQVTKAIRNAKYDRNGDAVVNGIRYKRLSRMESSWYNKELNLRYGDGKDEITYRIIASSLYPDKYPYYGYCVDNDYIVYWSEQEFAYFRYEPILWDILSIEDKEEPKILLLAHDAIDGGLCYDFESLVHRQNEYDYPDGLTWETCTLRKWLNDDFIDSAFTAEERSAIPSVKISNPSYSNDYRYVNGGNDTVDCAFLLKTDDISCEDYGFLSDPDEEDVFRRCSLSDYCSAKGVLSVSYTKYLFSEEKVDCLTSELKPTCEWLLRSPGYDIGYYSMLGNRGYLFDSCDIYQETPHAGIRPAIYVSCKLGKGVTTLEDRKKVSKIGGENIFTVKYKNGDYENFDIRKDVIKLSGEVEKVFFGNYYQQWSSKKDSFLSAEWDENNEAVIDDVKYKRVPRKELRLSGVSVVSPESRNDFNLYEYFVYEPIAWIPLTIENQNGKKQLYLLSEMIVGKYRLNTPNDEQENTWSSCSLRDYLNTTFCSEAFTKKEMSKLNVSLVGGADGSVAKDKVFLLSAADMIDQRYGFSTEPSDEDIRRRAAYSGYLKAATGFRGNDTYGTVFGNISANYWSLRPDDNRAGDRVDYTGKVKKSSLYDADAYYYFRPVICLDIE